MLTDIAIRKAQAQARDKPYKMFDSNGLFLLAVPRQHQWHRFEVVI
ncbi:unnamed protein product [Acidocella sp. C78]|nr:hypothetical protein [Acidocella sp. C78]CAG4929439.1 unnamed protein product [Acidocella sp. C78]